jgi:glycosyltransferase involved in cell wall biosynthesis
LGGAETYLEKLVQSLSRANYKVCIITARPLFKGLKYEKTVYANIYRTYNVNIFFQGDFSNKKSILIFLWRVFSLVLPIFNLCQIYLWIKREKPDVVHTHNLHGFHPLLLVILKLTKIPIVHTIHDYYFLCPRLSLLHRNGNLCGSKEESSYLEKPKGICLNYRNIFKILTQGIFTTVIAPSYFILDYHKLKGFFKNTNSLVIPNCSTFVISESTKTKDYPSGTFNFLYIGALSKHKGIQVLLNAMNLMRDLNLHLTIAGSGEFEKEIISLCSSDPRISFCGFISGEGKKNLFYKANVLLLPSIWYDNSPVVIYESFSYGMPVIASNIGGIPELVKMKKIMEEIENYPFLSSNALVSVQELSFENHAKKIIMEYKKIAQ